MISVKEAEEIHAILIRNFGGSNGTRDFHLLEAALSRPYQTFDSQDLYPTFPEKAAALLESLLINHPFVDGNKRTGYVLMRLVLLRANLDIRASQQEKYEMVIAVTEGKLRYEGIVEWLSGKLITI